MRYRLLGDLLSIKSALLYKRGYVDSTFKRHPSEQMNATKTNQSSSTTFMEYSFKFKIDKGSYSSFNLAEYFSDQTLKVLADDNDSSSVPSNLLMYQLSNDVVDRNYTIFEIFDSGSSTEMILNISEDIQKIEFFDEFLDYKKVDGLYVEVSEYNVDGKDNHLYKTPVMIVEFGPEVSYEPEDYSNKDEMPIKPDWDDESEKSYQLDIDEYTNKKFLSISTTSLDQEPILNLSISAHKSQIDPHRNQEDYVVQNKDMRDVLRNEISTLGKMEYSDIIMDRRSNTIVSTTEVNNDLPLLKTRMKLRQVEVDGIMYDDYLDYIEYNKGHKVHYKGEVYISLIDGNLCENPSISPMWQLISTVIEPDVPEDYGDPHVVNVRVNDPRFGTTDPIGPISVKYGYELGVKIITDKANIKSIKLDGVDQILPLNDVFTVQEVKLDHDLLVEFDPIYHKVDVITYPNPDYGKVTGGGMYLQNDIEPAIFTANPYYGYEFLGWYIDGKLVSEESRYEVDKIAKPFTLIAKFDRKKYEVTINSTEGGTYLPKDGNPTKVIVSHGDNLDISLTAFPGYELEFIKVNDNVVEEYYENSMYILNDIQSNLNVDLVFSRYQFHVIDPILGRINYVIIDDQLWSIKDVNDGTYLSLDEMINIDGSVRENINFRVPSKDDWQKLYDYFDEKYAALNIKSPSITRFDPNGWKDTIYRGKGRFRLDFMPYGVYVNNDIGFKGRNEESWHWSSTLDDSMDSVIASVLHHDSAIGFYEDIDTEYCKMPIRLMSDTLKVNLLGKSYRYVTTSIRISVLLLDDDTISSNDKYETYQVTQDWLLDNLDYDELGVHYEETECGRFGRLYKLDEVKKLNELLADTGFSVPSNLDYIFLEKYLGYNRDQVTLSQDGIFDVDLDTYMSGYVGTNEAKRLKTGNLIYSGIDWKGYEDRSLENSQLNVLPSGYAIVDEDGIEFKSMGTVAKFWTSTIVESNGTSMAHSRTISYSNDKIFRGVDQGSRNYMSVRPVRTTITKIL